MITRRELSTDAERLARKAVSHRKALAVDQSPERLHLVDALESAVVAIADLLIVKEIRVQKEIAGIQARLFDEFPVI